MFLQCELSNFQKWRRLPSLTGSCHRTGHREALSREEESQRPGLAELSSLHEVHGVKSCVALTFSQCALPDDHVDFCVCLTWSSGMRRSQTPGHLAVIFTLKGLLWFAYGWLISSQHLCFNLSWVQVLGEASRRWLDCEEDVPNAFLLGLGQQLLAPGFPHLHVCPSTPWHEWKPHRTLAGSQGVCAMKVLETSQPAQTGAKVSLSSFINHPVPAILGQKMGWLIHQP